MLYHSYVNIIYCWAIVSLLNYLAFYFPFIYYHQSYFSFLYLFPINLSLICFQILPECKYLKSKQINNWNILLNLPLWSPLSCSNLGCLPMTPGAHLLPEMSVDDCAGISFALVFYQCPGFSEHVSFWWDTMMKMSLHLSLHTYDISIIEIPGSKFARS